jgi:chloramphenicol-sensitive protein RarD
VGEQRRGIVFGFSAYVLWGLLPLYWLALRPASALEVLAHRFVWSFVFVAAALIALRRTSWLRSLRRQPRAAALLAAGAVLIAVNWLTYIWGVNSGMVVETSLGYFINPLVSILLGVLVLGERLRPVQWAAVAIGTGAVLVLTADYGRLPWVALVLAGTFSVYSLVKKKAAAPPLEGMAVESGIVAPVAVAYLGWLHASGAAQFGQVSAAHTTLLVVSGVATAVPLLLFAAAANRSPLSTLGVLQYVAPTLQFLAGVFLLHEPMPTVRWIGFALVWLALAMFTADGLRQHHRNRRTALIPVAEPA